MIGKRTIYRQVSIALNKHTEKKYIKYFKNLGQNRKKHIVELIRNNMERSD